jgi:hypothetical protein
MACLFATDDHVQVEATWGVYQAMIEAYREPDRAKGRVLMAAGVDERIRLAAQTLYQALIDAEATAVIGAGLWERCEDQPRSATTPGRGP